MRPPLHHGVVIAALLVLCLGPSAAALGREYVPLHVGFGRTSFLTVNLADAKAAFRVFTQSVGERKGYDLDVIVHTFESDADFVTAVTNGRLHLVIMVAWDYLEAGLEEHLDPAFLAIERNRGPQEYLLLVDCDSPYQHVGDLKGKAITLLENTNCEMSLNWLETLLIEEGFSGTDAFFRAAVMEKRPNKAVLPVFFGKTDACIVNAPVFETMKELNPQIGRKLRAIAVSEPLVDAVTYMTRGGWQKPHHREDMSESLRTLHEDVHGRQILTLFKADRLAPFEAAFMSGTKALKEKHDRLIREAQKQ